MILSTRMQNRLSRCRKASVQASVQTFLSDWGNRHSSPARCYDALRTLCQVFDDAGEYHDAEELMMAGQIVLDNELRRQRAMNERARQGRTLLAVGGMFVGGLLLGALAARR